MRPGKGRVAAARSRESESLKEETDGRREKLTERVKERANERNEMRRERVFKVLCACVLYLQTDFHTLRGKRRSDQEDVQPTSASPFLSHFCL